ncbi:hypothetical protein TTHERM_000716069 (macronuclear) [Tetrahymena thermophila SB210]|uniref:Uncharacterized protein n=1 Tax=Tetrahymena thermophila (strain SB210) TaxID=312017 RepID=W7XG62_TETTS|nr:hypothetical protein TTHERM_000716069 [Tetrahymena thermophila SB210]EWS71819.1 hypothetical protein TTHERM_000716069 [Tetrahymena thermophila SB210]|eukprot:XP_012655641.1 hypothetical protein TTHERM_000716069 [Tetrahymena thermophila SB210]
MEHFETSNSIEQVINKIGQVLVDKNSKLFKNDPNLKQQILLLQKKQKNLHLLCIKEQLKVDQLQNEIADLSEQRIHKAKEFSILKDTNELYDQEIQQAKEYLEKAKHDFNEKFDNFTNFEVELERCAKQLEFLKNQCDEKLQLWENIRTQTKQKEKYGQELKLKIKQKQIEIEKERESINKSQIQIQLYDQLEARLIGQIQVNQDKTDDLLNMNKILEQKLSDISEQPQELKKLLKAANGMLKEKNQLLEQQIQKISKLQTIMSQNQIGSQMKIRSISIMSDIQSDASSSQPKQQNNQYENFTHTVSVSDYQKSS